MTEQKIIERGIIAGALLLSDDFNSLVEDITHDLSLNILATTLDDEAGRNHFYLTYHGMRHFVNTLKSYVSVKDEIARKQDADNQQEDIDR